MEIVHFKDLDAFVRRTEHRTRQVVACVHVPGRIECFESVLPLGLQLPVRARDLGGRNWSSLQGKIKDGESAWQTLYREAAEEYNLTPHDVRETSYLVSTKLPVSPDSSKAGDWDYQWLHWFFLRTRRNFKINPEEVAHFSWCAGPNDAFDAMFETRTEKLTAMATAIAVALERMLLPEVYRPFAELASPSFSQVA